MKITMLGTTGIGKTTFLVAMYHDLGRKGRGDFKLRADRNLDAKLGRDWDEMASSGTWPPPSAEYVRMSFDLLYGHKPIATFEFVDYRGGAISDPSDANGVTALHKELDDSNAVLILADSWCIANQSDIIAETRNEIFRIQNLIEDSYFRNPGRTLEIAVVLTKFDLVKREQIEDFRQRCKILFSSLIDLVNERRTTLSGAFIPVSVAGYDTTTVTVTSNPGTFVKTVKSTLIDSPRPFNVNWPLLFCIAKGLERRVSDAQANINANQDTLIANLREVSLMNDLQSWLRGADSARTKVTEAGSGLRQERSAFIKLRQTLEPLLREVQILPDMSHGIFIPDELGKNLS